MVKEKTTLEGESIHCKKCGSVVWIAARDLHEGIVLRESLFVHPDGRPLMKGTLRECPTCRDKFQSINTKKRMTI